MSERDNIVETVGLTKQYGSTTALNNVSFTVNRGETFGLLGPNGAGKSTLMKIVATLTEPTAGKVTVEGIDVTDQPDMVRSLVGYIPQETALDHWLTGRQVLSLFADMYKVQPKNREKRITRVLDQVDLRDQADKQIDEYSGGMKRRLEIAAGLLHDPELVIFDEPTLGLDPAMRRKTWEYVDELRSTGATVLISTHYLDEAAELCDRVGVLADGELATINSPTELKKRHNDSLEEAFETITAGEVVA
ncbi:MAG: ABC transporter ATP-binding protein [Halobacteriaceae archaeon]